LSKRLPHNVPGPFFVDSTCIDCDTCRQLAPQVYLEDGDYSVVFHQPQNAEEERAALHALLACPTASIGVRGKNRAKEAREDFPILLGGEVYYLGFHSEKSFGGNSYLIRHPGGNWMIDSPRFLPFLAKKIEALGGLKYIFLTHRDDVADADQYAARFGARRIIHERDRSAADAEELVKGDDPVSFGEDFLVIPTPGHTRGHMVLLYRRSFLFSGDHLWFSRRTGRLGASKDVCWYDWKAQTHSMEKLLDYPFEWVLPGHGRRGRLPPAAMKKQLTELVASMREI
jgi:glyoxylase-like metal-dependent hydrolase (beta-lactamase superfamily II)/ferredoxin